MKFKLGDVIYWVESDTRFRKPVPCPMCFQKLFVEVILGDGTKTKVACGYCDRGMEGSTGTATVWEPDASVRAGTITGLSTRNGVVYEVGSHSVPEYEVFSDEASAQVEREKRFAVEKERAEKWFIESFKDASVKQVWSAGYHRNCIESAERDIRWHRIRLGMIKEKEANQ